MFNGRRYISVLAGNAREAGRARSCNVRGNGLKVVVSRAAVIQSVGKVVRDYWIFFW